MIDIVRDLQAHEGRLLDRLKPADEIGRWYIEAMKREISKHSGRLLVAEWNGAVAGYAALLLEVSSDGEREEVLYTYAHITDLAVAEPLRGRGIGSALLRECETLAISAGQKWLRLGVLALNHGARRFYAREGLGERYLTLEKPLP